MDKDLSIKEMYMIRFLYTQSKLSKCLDRQTSAILTNLEFNQIYSIGINGGPNKGVNCMCNKDSKYTCVHAEMNCVIKNTNKYSEKILICTLQPCHMCAAIMINADINIKQVWFMDDYNDNTGLHILLDAGIKVFKIKSTLGSPVIEITKESLDNL